MFLNNKPLWAQLLCGVGVFILASGFIYLVTLIPQTSIPDFPESEALRLVWSVLTGTAAAFAVVGPHVEVKGIDQDEGQDDPHRLPAGRGNTRRAGAGGIPLSGHLLRRRCNRLQDLCRTGRSRSVRLLDRASRTRHHATHAAGILASRQSCEHSRAQSTPEGIGAAEARDSPQA